MGGLCTVKLCRSEGEAVVTLLGEDYRVTMADYEALGISDGDEVDEERAALLEEAAEKLSCIKKAFTYLSYRALPTLKLRQKLKKAGFADGAIEKTVVLLKKKGYLNDEELCADYAIALRNGKGFGKARLRKELYAKGFGREQTEEALENAFEDYDAVAAVTALLEKKFPSLQPDDRQGRSKAAAYLYRMGYSYDDINNALEAFGRE